MFYWIYLASIDRQPIDVVLTSRLQAVLIDSPWFSRSVDKVLRQDGRWRVDSDFKRTIGNTSGRLIWLSSGNGGSISSDDSWIILIAWPERGRTRFQTIEATDHDGSGIVIGEPVWKGNELSICGWGAIPAAATNWPEFGRFRKVSGHWRQIYWSVLRGEEEIADAGAHFIHCDGKIDPDEIEVETREVPEDLFSCHICPYCLYRSRWVWMGKTYCRAAKRRLPTPFASLVDLMESAKQGRRNAFNAFVEPSLRKKAWNQFHPWRGDPQTDAYAFAKDRLLESYTQPDALYESDAATAFELDLKQRVIAKFRRKGKRFILYYLTQAPKP